VDNEVGFSKPNFLEILPVECWWRPATGRCCTLELAAPDRSVRESYSWGDAFQVAPCWEAAQQSAGVGVGFVH